MRGKKNEEKGRFNVGTSSSDWKHAQKRGVKKTASSELGKAVG